MSLRSCNFLNPPSPEAQLFCLSLAREGACPRETLASHSGSHPYHPGPGKLTGRWNGRSQVTFPISFVLSASKQKTTRPPTQFLKFQKFSNKPLAKRHGISTTGPGAGHTTSVSVDPERQVRWESFPGKEGRPPPLGGGLLKLVPHVEAHRQALTLPRAHTWMGTHSCSQS